MGRPANHRSFLAKRVQAKLVLESDNGPTTPEADPILAKNEILACPDFLANAGGVTVSYSEQVQNAYMFYCDAEEVYARLDKKMTTAFKSAWDARGKYRCTMGQAAYVVAVGRVAEAVKMRGIVTTQS